MRFLLFAILLMQAACAAPLQTIEKVQRQPLQKTGFVLKSPAYQPRIAGYDEKTGEEITYDHKPRIELVDEKAGKYAFKWIGYDGKEKVIIYQRHDAVDVVVAASATKTPEGKYLYTYNVKNLPSSGTHLSVFMPQNFANDVKPVKVNGMYIGRMSNQIQQFTNGNWVSFHILEDSTLTISQGESIELQLHSSSPPSLVECRVYGGPLTMQGVGEEMPTVLEAALPGYEVLPKGYTVGPVDSLKSLSSAERAQYIVSLLPQLRQLGWITEDAARWYEQNLPRNNFDKVFKRAEQDLKAERITTEVFSMIEAIDER